MQLWGIPSSHLKAGIPRVEPRVIVMGDRVQDTPPGAPAATSCTTPFLCPSTPPPKLPATEAGGKQQTGGFFLTQLRVTWGRNSRLHVHSLQGIEPPREEASPLLFRAWPGLQGEEEVAAQPEGPRCHNPPTPPVVFSLCRFGNYLPRNPLDWFLVLSPSLPFAYNRTPIWSFRNWGSGFQPAASSVGKLSTVD